MGLGKKRVVCVAEVPHTGEPRTSGIKANTKVGWSKADSEEAIVGRVLSEG